MKKKIQIGPFKFKISYKNSRWFSFLSKTKIKKQITFDKVDPVKLLEYKLYRIFKEEYCQFFPANNYGDNQTEPSSFVYYINKKNSKELIGLVNINEDLIEFYKSSSKSFLKEKYLIGEFMFGEDKISFFKRKNILIKETIENYSIVQDDLILAFYNKDWINKQGVYQ
jgi:hypothetical protein